MPVSMSVAFFISLPEFRIFFSLSQPFFAQTDMDLNHPNAPRLLAFLNRSDLTPELIDAYFERPGKDIGRKLGQRLIDDRPQGGYQTLKDVLKVRGIGKKRLQLMLNSPFEREGREAMPASLEFRVHSPKPALPASFLQSRQGIQVAEGEESGWQFDIRAGEARGPGGEPFQIVEHQHALQSKWSYRYVTGVPLWKVTVAAQVAWFDQPDPGNYPFENRLGTGLSSDAFRGNGGVPATVRDLEFDVYTGYVREDVRENREVIFLLLQSEHLPEPVPLIWYGPWQLESESQIPAVLLRQIQSASEPADAPRDDFFFDSDVSWTNWLAAPIIIGHGEDRGWDNSETTEADLERNFRVARENAPRVPNLTAVPSRPDDCDPWTRKVLIVNDYGHSQTDLNEIAKGVAGVINVSSRNDLIEKLKVAVDLEECECIGRLSAATDRLKKDGVCCQIQRACLSSRSWPLPMLDDSSYDICKPCAFSWPTIIVLRADVG